MKTFVVIGLGRFGSAVAKRLYELGREVLAIDENPEQVQQVAESVTRAVTADCKDKEVLRALGVGSIDCAIVAIGSDLTDSILTTMTLKELGVPQVICKAQNESHKKVLQKLGADRVILPEREMANKLAQGLASANVMEYIELSPDYGIVEFAAPEKWQGKTLRELNIRVKVGVNVIAIRKAEKIIVSPQAEYTVEPKDTLVALGDNKALEAVRRL